jgi:hypothetical protein
MGGSVFLLMIAFEGFGLFSFSSSSTSPEEIDYFADPLEVAAVHQSGGFVAHSNPLHSHYLLTYDHSTFFMFLSLLMTVIAWMRFISLDNMFVCFFYSLIFGFITTKGTINWAFPYHLLISHTQAALTGHQLDKMHSHQIYYYPFFFLIILKVLNTFISLWNPKNSSHNLNFTYYFPLIYSITILWPVINLFLITLLVQTNSEGEATSDYEINKSTLYSGIIISTLISHGSLTISFRLKEILNYMNNKKETIYSSKLLMSFNVFSSLANTGTQSREEEFSLVLFNCFMTVSWGVILLFFQVTSMDYDLIFPFIALIFIIYDSEIEISRIPVFSRILTPFFHLRKYSPMHFWSILSVVFWYLSFFHHWIVMDFPFFGSFSTDSYVSHLSSLITTVRPHSYFGFDSNISLWSKTESWWLPYLNFFYCLCTIPVVYYSIWNFNSAGGIQSTLSSSNTRGKGAAMISDDVLFFLSLLNVIPIIGANVDCVRYLGILGLFSGIYRSNYLFRKKKLSNEYI